MKKVRSKQETLAAMGRKSRRDGAAFELKTRKFFEDAGYIVTKWQNNVDLTTQKLIPAKSNRFRMRTGGFPDFLCLLRDGDNFKTVGCESKLHGILTREEKNKIIFLKKNNIFSHLVMARRDKDGQFELVDL